MFALFLIKGTDLLKDRGYLGFIIPNTILRVNTYIKLRKLILDNCKIIKIIDTGTDVFKATASTIVLILQKEANRKLRNKNNIEISSLSKDGVSQPHYIKQEYFFNNKNYVFNILVEKSFIEVLKKIKENCALLEDGIAKSYNGVATKKDKTKYISNYPKNSNYKPLLEGKNIKRFRIDFKNKYINYDKKILHRPRDEKIFLSPEKIIAQRIGGGSQVIIATLDNEQYYTFNSVNNIILSNPDFSIKYILGLLNSKLLNWYYIMKFTNMSFLTVNISKTNLEQLPIKVISTEEQKPFITLVDKMLTLNKRLNEIGDKKTDERQRIEEKINKTDAEIDELVYKMYGITESEKKIIEESLK